MRRGRTVEALIAAGRGAGAGASGAEANTGFTGAAGPNADWRGRLAKALAPGPLPLSGRKKVEQPEPSIPTTSAATTRPRA